MGSFASKFLLLGGSSSATAFAEDRFRLVKRAISGVCIFAASAFEFVGPVGTNLGPAATLCSREAILHGAEGLLAELAASVDKLLLMREVIVFVQALLPMRLTILDVVEFMASRVLCCLWVGEGIDWVCNQIKVYDYLKQTKENDKSMRITLEVVLVLKTS